MNEDNNFFDIEQIFKYHAPTDDQCERYQQLRRAGKELALKILFCCPLSREKRIALINLQQVIMWANASIAINERNPE